MGLFTRNKRITITASTRRTDGKAISRTTTIESNKKANIIRMDINGVEIAVKVEA